MPYSPSLDFAAPSSPAFAAPQVRNSVFSPYSNFHDPCWDLSLSASREEKKNPSLLLLLPRPSWRHPSTPPHQLHRRTHFQRRRRGAAPLPCSCRGLNKFSGGLGPVSASRLGCHGRLYLGFAHLTAPSAGTLCSGKNDVKEENKEYCVWPILQKIMRWERIARK